MSANISLESNFVIFLLESRLKILILKILIFRSEPIGSVAPKVNVGEDLKSVKAEMAKDLTLLCAAQAYPMPVFRSVGNHLKYLKLRCFFFRVCWISRKNVKNYFSIQNQFHRPLLSCRQSILDRWTSTMVHRCRFCAPHKASQPLLSGNSMRRLQHVQLRWD